MAAPGCFFGLVWARVWDIGSRSRDNDHVQAIRRGGSAKIIALLNKLQNYDKLPKNCSCGAVLYVILLKGGISPVVF